MRGKSALKTSDQREDVSWGWRSKGSKAKLVGSGGQASVGETKGRNEAWRVQGLNETD